MADLNTKQRIIHAAIRLFNEEGLANVRLQQIATETGISSGNLAYHFRNKDAIVEAVLNHLYEAAADLLTSYRRFPNLIDFDNQLTDFFSFLEKYPFYFADLPDIERNYANDHASLKSRIAKIMNQIRKRFDFNERRGIIKAETHSGMYDSITQAIWLIMIGQVSQNVFHQQSHSDFELTRFKSAIWQQIYPHFTPQGIAEYQQLIYPMLHHGSFDD